MQRRRILKDWGVLKKKKTPLRDWGVGGVGLRHRLVYKVVDCTVNGLMCHVDSVGLNPLDTRGPTEILKPRSRW